MARMATRDGSPPPPPAGEGSFDARGVTADSRYKCNTRVTPLPAAAGEGAIPKPHPDRVGGEGGDQEGGRERVEGAEGARSVDGEQTGDEHDAEVAERQPLPEPARGWPVAAPRQQERETGEKEYRRYRVEMRRLWAG